MHARRKRRLPRHSTRALVEGTRGQSSSTRLKTIPRVTANGDSGSKEETRARFTLTRANSRTCSFSKWLGKVSKMMFRKSKTGVEQGAG